MMEAARNNPEQKMKLTISKEDYLKAIAEAESEGEPVIAATIARWLNVTPAVALAFRRLQRDKLSRQEAGGGFPSLRPVARSPTACDIVTI